MVRRSTSIKAYIAVWSVFAVLGAVGLVASLLETNDSSLAETFFWLRLACLVWIAFCVFWIMVFRRKLKLANLKCSRYRYKNPGDR